MSITTVPTHAESGVRVCDALRSVLGFFEQLGAATRVAAAVRSRRKPSMVDLEILGMEDLRNVNLDRLSGE